MEMQPISDSQWIFQRRKSTVTVLLSTGLRCLKEGEKLEQCFFHFRKAFDSVPHHALLGNLRVDSLLVKWIYSYLSGRKQQVVVNGSSSDPSAIWGSTRFSGWSRPVPNIYIESHCNKARKLTGLIYCRFYIAFNPESLFQMYVFVLTSSVRAKSGTLTKPVNDPQECTSSHLECMQSGGAVVTRICYSFFLSLLYSNVDYIWTYALCLKYNMNYFISRLAFSLSKLPESQDHSIISPLSFPIYTHK